MLLVSGLVFMTKYRDIYYEDTYYNVLSPRTDETLSNCSTQHTLAFMSPRERPP